MVKPRAVVLPYNPRTAFMPFHERKQRWACMVCHRRAGKTVSAVNDLIKGAVTTPGRAPLFGYVAPFRAQAKSIAWDYLKYYARPITKDVSESDLILKTTNGAQVRLFGADNADALRGLGFDGIFMDEYGDFRPSVWGNVIRPALSDKQGWAVFAGTPKGKNQFWDVWDQARNNPDWFRYMLKASESGLLPQSELVDARRTLSEDQYEQEYECSFEAAILGAFYGREMRELADAKRIRKVPYDPTLSTYTAWDIGHTDDTSIWWYQAVRNEVHVIDFYSVSGSGVEDVGNLVKNRKIADKDGKPVTPHYATHFLPHDARAATFASNGRTTIEQLAGILGLASLAIVPRLAVQDGIQAARMTLPHCWFDETNCKEGLEALRQYEREFDEDKKVFRANPKHNWASNPADAFRYLATSWREQTPQAPIPRTDVPLIVGPGNTATLEDMWAASKARTRYARI